MKDDTKKTVVNNMLKNVMYGTTDIGAYFSHPVATAELERKDGTIWLTVEDLGDDILFYAYNKDIIYRCFINDPADKEIEPFFEKCGDTYENGFFDFLWAKNIEEFDGIPLPRQYEDICSVLKEHPEHDVARIIELLLLLCRCPQKDEVMEDYLQSGSTFGLGLKDGCPHKNN